MRNESKSSLGFMGRQRKIECHISICMTLMENWDNLMILVMPWSSLSEMKLIRYLTENHNTPGCRAGG